MAKYLRPVCCLVLAILLQPQAAFAQFSPLPSVRGVVRVRNHASPPERIEVVLLTNDGRPRDRVFTDSLGNFQFVGLTAGAYILVIEHPSYERLEQRVEVIGGLSRTLTQRNFTLEPKAAEGASASASTVSSERLRLPKDAQEALARGAREIERRNFSKAAEYLDKVLAVAPKFAEALFQRGTVALQQNEPAGARGYFEKAVAANPQYGDALIGLGTAFSREGNSQAAIDPLTKGLAIHPKSYLGLFERCRANLGLGQMEAALADCEAAKQNADGVRPELMVLQGNLYLRTNRNPEALREFQEYLKHDSKSPTADAIRDLVERMKKAGIKAP